MGSRSLYIISDKFFQATRDSILLQIGKKEFEEMQSKCSLSGWPEGFYKPDLNEQEDIAFNAELNKLKIYKIAAFTHIYNGKTFDRYAILRVPFKENQQRSPPMQWDVNGYFLLKENDENPFIKRLAPSRCG